MRNHCPHKRNDLKHANILPGHRLRRGRGFLAGSASRSSAAANFTVAAADSPAALPKNTKALVRRVPVSSVRCAFVNLSVKSKFTTEKKKSKALLAYFMPAVPLINWGIEACAGNSNKENVTKAEILP